LFLFLSLALSLSSKLRQTGWHGTQGRDADEEARYDALMESKGHQLLRARALQALAAAWPSSASTRLQLAPAVLQLLEPYFKSPSIDERLAAIAVVSAFCTRMSAQMEEGGGGIAKEWEGE